MKTAPPVRLRTVALPVEHGGWGFLAEPLLLGLLVAPSAGGLCIAVATVAAFLVRHPAKLFWRNRHRLDVSPRFRIARLLAALYAVLAVAGFVVGGWIAGWGALVPFLALSPLLAVYAVYDLSNRARRLLPELAAPMGLAASAPAIATAGGLPIAEAWALWLILQARAVPSILYVRARLRLERGTGIDRRPALVAHAMALVAVLTLWAAGLSPALTVAVLALLLWRAALGLSDRRRPAKAKQVGFSELAYGTGYVLATALGLRLGL